MFDNMVSRYRLVNLGYSGDKDILAFIFDRKALEKYFDFNKVEGPYDKSQVI